MTTSLFSLSLSPFLSFPFLSLSPLFSLFFFFFWQRRGAQARQPPPGSVPEVKSIVYGKKKKKKDVYLILTQKCVYGQCKGQNCEAAYVLWFLCSKVSRNPSVI